MFNLRLREVPIRQKSIVLTGFMGVGKTTIGELVAKKLYRSFIDIDQEIEKHFGMSTTDIFQVHGEEVFRDFEKTIQSFSNEQLKIISIVAVLCRKCATLAFKTVLLFTWMYRKNGKNDSMF